MDSGPSAAAVAEEAKRHLRECSRIAIFDHGGRVVHANCKVLPGEAQHIASSFQGREAAMLKGLRLEGRRYEVHRFHPPLLYGRAMLDCEPEASTGIAACRVERSRFGSGPCYVVVTYEQPHTSARVVPRLVAFAEQHLEAP